VVAMWCSVAAHWAFRLSSGYRSAFSFRRGVLQLLNEPPFLISCRCEVLNIHGRYSVRTTRDHKQYQLMLRAVRTLGPGASVR